MKCHVINLLHLKRRELEMSDFKFQGDHYHYSSKLYLHDFGSSLLFISIHCMTSTVSSIYIKRRVWLKIFKMNFVA